MELRVVVIAVISLIIVSMSFIVQGQRPPGLPQPGAESNLLDEAAVANSSAMDPSSTAPLSTSTPVDPWGSRDDNELMESDSRSGRGFELDTAGDSESLEPDLPIHRKMSMPAESSGVTPQPPAADPTANVVAELAASNPEPFVVPEAGSESLETVWQSAESSDLATAWSPSPPPSADLDSADPPSAESPNSAVIDTSTEPLVLAPALDVAQEQAVEPQVESSPSLEQQSIRDIPPSVAQIARNHLQYGNSLARRGSLFSARQEFFSGLRLIIESLDLVNGVATHREHYALAIVALNEAEDFVASSGDEVSNSVPRIVDLHQSKILSPQEVQSLTPMAAMQAYFAFAQVHFSASCEHSWIASELLFSLGKLHTVKATQGPSGQATDMAIAILMYQAALNVDSNHFLSANELGVAMARLGHYEPARAALLHSIAIKPTPEAWLNLSIVHRELGETDLAELALAEKKAAEVARGNGSQVAQQIRWMAPNEFASTQQVHYEDGESDSSKTANAASANPITQNPPLGGGIWTSFKRSMGAK